MIYLCIFWKRMSITLNSGLSFIYHIWAFFWMNHEHDYACKYMGMFHFRIVVRIWQTTSAIDHKWQKTEGSNIVCQQLHSNFVIPKHVICVISRTSGCSLISKHNGKNCHCWAFYIKLYWQTWEVLTISEFKASIILRISL